MASPLTVVRTRHEKQFVIIPNAIAQNSRLTLAARGLLTHLLSLPDGYRVSVSSLAEQFVEGHAAINRAKNELMEHGYVTQRRLNVNGRWQWEMSVFDTPRPATPGPETIVEPPAPEVEQAPEPEAEQAPEPAPEQATNNPEPITRKPQRGKGDILERTGTNTGGGRGRAPHPAHSVEEPSPRCARHPDGDPGTPCRGCGQARERHQQWVEDAARRRHEADKAWTRDWLDVHHRKKSPGRSRQALAAAEFEAGKRQARSKYKTPTPRRARHRATV